MPPTGESREAPLWLLALAALVLAAMAGAGVYALRVALANLPRIGV